MLLVSKRCGECGGAERTLDDYAKRQKQLLLHLHFGLRRRRGSSSLDGGSGKTTVGTFRRKCGVCRMQDSLKSAVCSRCLASLPRERYRPEDWRRASIVNFSQRRKSSSSYPSSSHSSSSPPSSDFLSCSAARWRPPAAGAACLSCLEETRREERARRVEALSVGYLCPIFSWMYSSANRDQASRAHRTAYRTPLNVPDLALRTVAGGGGGGGGRCRPRAEEGLVGEYDVIFYVGQDYRCLDKVYYSRRTRGRLSLRLLAPGDGDGACDDGEDGSSPPVLRGNVKMDASTWRYAKPEGGELNFVDCPVEQGVGIRVDGDGHSSGVIKFVKFRAAVPLCADSRVLAMKTLENHERPRNWPVTLEEAEAAHKVHAGTVRQTWLCDRLGLPDLAAARVGEYTRPPPFFFFEGGDLWIQFHDANLHKRPLVLVARRRRAAGGGS